MSNFIAFIQLLVSLGPAVAKVWPLIMAILEAANGGKKLPRRMRALKGDESAHLIKLETIFAQHGGLAAAGFSIHDVLSVFEWIQEHPKLMAAIQALIEAFLPAPQPPADTPPAAV